MKNLLKITTATLIILIFIFSDSIAINANDNQLATRLVGRFLLQVEDKGQIWYINTNDLKRYSITLENSLDTFRSLSLGITNADLDKIPTDTDYLPENQDSDNDGYNDKTEARFGYNLFSNGRAHFDQNLINRVKGRFLLQIEDHGRIWYVNPPDSKKYEVTRENTLSLFQSLSLGINNDNLEKISIQQLESATSAQKIPTAPVTEPLSSSSPVPTPPPSYSAPSPSLNIISSVANSISRGSSNVTSYFTPDLQPSIEYTLNSLDNSGKSAFADLLLNSSLKNSSSNSKTYTTDVSFNNGYASFDVKLEKQEDGEWLISSL